MLPGWDIPATPKLMERWLGRLGVTGVDYLAWAGEKTLSDFAKNNPRWPLRAWVGIVLEAIDGGRLKPKPKA